MNKYTERTRKEIEEILINIYGGYELKAILVSAILTNNFSMIRRRLQ